MQRIFVLNCRFLARCVLLCAGAAGISSATPLNPVLGFSSISDPNGSWSYGYTDTLGGTFQPFTTFSRLWWQLDAWNTPSIDALSIANNFTGSTINVNTAALPPGETWFHPGPAGQYAVLRWTAPVDTAVNIFGMFH